MSEPLDNALVRFWLATWAAVAEARNRCPDDEQEAYEVFCRLAPAIVAVPSGPKRAADIEPPEQPREQSKQRRQSIEIITPPKAKTALCFRHKVTVFDESCPDGVTTEDLPDCKILRQDFTYNCENFDSTRHSTRATNLAMKHCGEGMVKHRGAENELVIEHHFNVETYPGIQRANRVDQDVQYNLASPWKFLERVTCPICYLSIREDKTLLAYQKEHTYGIMVPPCGHSICFNCFSECSKRTAKCPTCRGPIRPAYELKPRIL